MGLGEQGDVQAASPCPDRRFCSLVIKFVNHHLITCLLMQLPMWSFVEVTWGNIIILMVRAGLPWEETQGAGGRGEKEFYQPRSRLQECM